MSVLSKRSPVWLLALTLACAGANVELEPPARSGMPGPSRAAPKPAQAAAELATSEPAVTEPATTEPATAEPAAAGGASVRGVRAEIRTGDLTAVDPRGESPYDVVRGWPALADGITLGETSGVGVDSHGHVFLFHRGAGPSILGLDPKDGRVVVRFGEGLFKNPHGLAIGANDEVWVTDTLRHQVLRFSHDGALLDTFGEEGVAGADLAHFDQPTDLAFASTGDVFVSDGYGNSRVVRLSQQGRPLDVFGRKGTGVGEFDTPHGIAIDARDRIYVADRGNRRVQVFDLAGKPLAAWGPEVFGAGSRPWGVEIAGDRLYVIDGGHMDPAKEGFAQLTRLSLAGHVEARWSRYGSAPGELAWGHDLTVGADGAVYVGEVRINDRVQKFVPAR